jgi:hypothetical protein
MSETEASSSDEHQSLAGRRETASEVPFFLRAWWLRNYAENSDIVFGSFPSGTVPLWCLHSDPQCDAANIDHAPA